ncbi:ATP-binding protein [Streptomyces sp. NPDC047043]|uniref:ATP-binding protein n=1 Tax=Streptomyces sp. NPDC047043 TaxID=3154497 RepID=UPI0033F16A8B
MKQSAAKTLGVAALGAAFAATGAGAANAAPAVPDATGTLNTVTQALPGEGLTHAMPAAQQAVTQGKPAIERGLASVQPSARKALADGPTMPVSGLLGGLPMQPGLPQVNGAPVG